MMKQRVFVTLTPVVEAWNKPEHKTQKCSITISVYKGDEDKVRRALERLIQFVLNQKGE